MNTLRIDLGPDACNFRMFLETTSRNKVRIIQRNKDKSIGDKITLCSKLWDEFVAMFEDILSAKNTMLKLDLNRKFMNTIECKTHGKVMVSVIKYTFLENQNILRVELDKVSPIYIINGVSLSNCHFNNIISSSQKVSRVYKSIDKIKFK